MSNNREPVLKIPNNIIDDALSYRSQVEKFINNEINAVSFRAYRVPMGIYEQRTTGKFMVRIRIGAGLVLKRVFGLLHILYLQQTEQSS